MGISRLPTYQDIGSHPFYLKKIDNIRKVPNVAHTWYAYLTIQLKGTGEMATIFYTFEPAYADFLHDLSSYLPHRPICFTPDGLLSFSHFT